MKYPCLCVETSSSTIERDLDFTAGQTREIIERLHLGCTCVCSRQDSQPCARETRSTNSRHTLKDVEQLSNTCNCDEADQDIHLVAAGNLMAKIGQEGWRTFARSKQPRDGKSGLRYSRRGPNIVNCLEYLSRLDQGINTGTRSLLFEV